MLAILGKMVKQRQESARAYEEGGRLELAEKERAEIAVIEDYLPRQLSEKEVETAIDEAISSTGAEGLRDMGKVMGALKAKYTGRMDFGAAGRNDQGAAGLEAWPLPRAHAGLCRNSRSSQFFSSTRSTGVRKAPSSTSRPPPDSVR